MAAAHPAFSILLGQTGAGKSTVGQKFIERLGHRGVVFEASDSIEAHTQKPKSVIVGGIKVTDTPGLMDTEGREKDIKNVELIVNTVRSVLWSWGLPRLWWYHRRCGGLAPHKR